MSNTNYSHSSLHSPVTALPNPSSGPPLADTTSRPPGRFDTPIRSKDLFNERACVFIEHEGMIYALRTTRAGKLILTK